LANATKLDALRERQSMAEVDRIGRSPHVSFPSVRTRLPASPCLLLATERAADFRSRYTIRLVVEVGSQLPCHATAAGKALLARQDDESVRARYLSAALPTFTKNPLTSIDRLLAELAKIRKNGWAETRQEIIDGITSFGVALIGASEPAGIGLSVSFPVANLNEKQQNDVRHALLRTADKFAQRIGDTYRAR